MILQRRKIATTRENLHKLGGFGVSPSTYNKDGNNIKKASEAVKTY